MSGDVVQSPVTESSMLLLDTAESHGYHCDTPATITTTTTTKPVGGAGRLRRRSSHGSCAPGVIRGTMQMTQSVGGVVGSRTRRSSVTTGCVEIGGGCGEIRGEGGGGGGVVESALQCTILETRCEGRQSTSIQPAIGLEDGGLLECEMVREGGGFTGEGSFATGQPGPDPDARVYVYKYRKGDPIPPVVVPKQQPTPDLLRYLDIHMQRLLDPRLPEPVVPICEQVIWTRDTGRTVVGPDDDSLRAEKAVALAVSGTRQSHDLVVAAINPEFVARAFETMGKIVAGPVGGMEDVVVVAATEIVAADVPVTRVDTGLRKGGAVLPVVGVVAPPVIPEGVLRVPAAVVTRHHQPSLRASIYTESKTTSGPERQTILAKDGLVLQANVKATGITATDLDGILSLALNCENLPQFGPHHHALPSHKTSSWLKRKFKAPPAPSNTPNALTNTLTNALTNIHTAIPMGHGDRQHATNYKAPPSSHHLHHHHLLRELRARRELALQQEYLGNTGVSPGRYLGARCFGVGGGVRGAVGGGGGQALLSTVNTRQPSPFTYSVLGHVGLARYNRSGLCNSALPLDLTSPEARVPIRDHRRIFRAHQTRRVVHAVCKAKYEEMRRGVLCCPMGRDERRV